MAASFVVLHLESAEALYVAVFLTETLDPASGVDDTLLAGIERMAGGADFNVDAGLANRGARLEAVAAAADDIDFGVVRMDFGFHCGSPAADGECGRPKKGRIMTATAKKNKHRATAAATLLRWIK